jgi:hypothetical protein
MRAETAESGKERHKGMTRRRAAVSAVGIVIVALAGWVTETRLDRGDPLPPPPVTELQPERPATVHLGYLAAVRVDSNFRYTVGSAGESLTLVKQTTDARTTVYVYRASAPGNETLVLTPRDPGPDGCISCVTKHYFVTIVK